MTARQAEALSADASVVEAIAAIADDYPHHAEYARDLATRIRDEVIVPWLRAPLPGGPVRQFTHAHLRVVYLLAESAGSTHHQLRRLWDAKASRPGDLAWPWISDSGVRTRTAELKAWGLVEDTGARGRTPAGGQSAIWTLVTRDPDALGRDHQAIPGVDAGAREAYLGLLDEAGDNLVIRSSLHLAASVARIPLEGARA